MPAVRIAVVGGGISGLAAAWELTSQLARLADPVEIILLEASPATGGKLRTATLAGQQIDVGAESVLARRPEALDLVGQAGLADRVVHPTAATPSIWSRGRRWPLPPRTLMGIPSAPDTARGLLTDAEVARLESERALATPVDDVSVGDFVEARLGPAVVDRLVEPLLAGVYAGHARRLSLRATVPALWDAAQRGAGLVETAADVARRADLAAGGAPSPVFAGYRGGLGRLAADLAERLVERGVRIQTSATVREVVRTPTGWALVVGPTTEARRLEVDAVVLALPPAPTARLVREVAPHASADLAALEMASVGIVTLALSRSELGRGLDGSGFLVPPTEAVSIKAATFSSTKWQWVDHLDPALVYLRASLGRAGESATLQRDDADLVAVVRQDLETVLGPLPSPVAAHVQRWGGGLPQYAVGHLDLAARTASAFAGLPGLEVAGAAYDGVGVPACIASGRRAARSAATHVLSWRERLRE